MINISRNHPTTETGINNCDNTLGAARCQPIIDIVQANTTRLRISKIDIIATERSALIMRIDDAMTRKIKKRYSIPIKTALRECAIQTISPRFTRGLLVLQQYDAFRRKSL